MKTRTNFFKHLHPPLIRSRTLDPLSTLGLGIVCMTCFLLLVVTGLTLLLYYVPHQDAAYDRILHIITTLRYGKVIRNLHYLAANVLLIAGILHLSRVFFTGSYKGRWLNWIYGLLLLALIFLSNYTGYLLPWDQTSYWAIRVGSNLTTYFPWVGLSLKNFLLGGEDICIACRCSPVSVGHTDFPTSLADQKRRRAGSTGRRETCQVAVLSLALPGGTDRGVSHPGLSFFVIPFHWCSSR